MTVRRGIPVAGMLSLRLILGNSIAAAPSIAAGEGAESFQSQLGWWSGTARLGFKDGKREAVKCRVTSRWDDAGGKLLQAVRFASASGKVDIKSEIQDAGVSSRVLGANEPTSSKATSLAKVSKGDSPSLFPAPISRPK